MLEKGRATIVLGAQYGDEGKGKLVDVLAEKADLVCRVQGGNNAGHTIWIGNEKIVTHLLPSGILRPQCEVAIGAGVVVDPFILRDEFSALRAKGVDLSPARVHIDPRAHLVLPAHRQEDSEREAARASGGGEKIGTTGRGIGPAYAGRAFREGPRMADLASPERFQKALSEHPRLRAGLDGATLDSLRTLASELRPFIKDVAVLANDKLAQGARVLVEGAQGSMLDVSYGTYPFVTSSNLVAGACPGGLGIAPWHVRSIMGVCKAYATRVGNGPFPGELAGSLEGRIREVGKEFGSTTGRPRRVGWLDLVALRYLARLNGFTSLGLMKADVLSGLGPIGIVTAYRDSRTKQPMLEWPMAIDDWQSVEPVVDFCDGWTNVADVNGTLTKEFTAFVDLIETHVGVPVCYASTGPERSEGVWRDGRAL